MRKIAIYINGIKENGIINIINEAEINEYCINIKTFIDLFILKHNVLTFTARGNIKQSVLLPMFRL